jgi:hypothetical protein
MRVTLAPRCLQVALHHRSNQRRLRRFIELIHSIDDSIRVEISPECELERCLEDASLLISTTRQIKFPYRDDELDIIERFARRPKRPGHVMILSNHDHFAVQDSRLSCRFGFTFSWSTFTGKDPKRNVILKATPEKPHWVTVRAAAPPCTLTVEIRNCCCILPCGSEGRPLYFLNRGMEDRTKNHTEPESRIFGYIIDSGSDTRGVHGRIAGLADSGIIGAPMPQNPGPGLDASDKFEFIRNLICWLLYSDNPP